MGCTAQATVLADFLCNLHAICLRKAYVSDEIRYILLVQAVFVLFRIQIHTAPSFFVTDKAITMTKDFKGIVGDNLHWYWSILLFRMN